jgi:hypothetical protein
MARARRGPEAGSGRGPRTVVAARCRDDCGSRCCARDPRRPAPRLCSQALGNGPGFLERAIAFAVAAGGMPACGCRSASSGSSKRPSASGAPARTRAPHRRERGRSRARRGKAGIRASATRSITKGRTTPRWIVAIGGSGAIPLQMERRLAEWPRPRAHAIRAGDQRGRGQHLVGEAADFDPRLADRRDGGGRLSWHRNPGRAPVACGGHRAGVSVLVLRALVRFADGQRMPPLPLSGLRC